MKREEKANLKREKERRKERIKEFGRGAEQMASHHWVRLWLVKFVGGSPEVVKTIGDNAAIVRPKKDCAGFWDGQSWT